MEEETVGLPEEVLQFWRTSVKLSPPSFGVSQGLHPAGWEGTQGGPWAAGPLARKLLGAEGLHFVEVGGIASYAHAGGDRGARPVGLGGRRVLCVGSGCPSGWKRVGQVSWGQWRVGLSCFLDKQLRVAWLWWSRGRTTGTSNQLSISSQ